MTCFLTASAQREQQSNFKTAACSQQKPAVTELSHNNVKISIQGELPLY